MFATSLRWLRSQVRRPVGLALAAVVPTVLIGWLLQYEVTTSRPWDHHLLLRGEMTVGNSLRKHGRPAPLRPDLVFLGVDDATMKLDMLWPEEVEASRAFQLISQSKGDWNWSREVHALALDRLVSAGAKLVVFDMVFPKPFTGDDAFRAALDRHRQQVVIGAKFNHQQLVIGNQTVASAHEDWEGPAPTLIDDPAHDPRVGYVNYEPDIDGAIRTLLFHTTQSAYNGRPPQPDEPTYYSEVAGVLRQLGRADLVPADSEPRAFRYTDLAHGVDYPVHPLWEIFSDSLWKQNYHDGEFFKDKIVIIGAAAPILHDEQPTPYGPILGPDLQLQALGAALSQDFLTLTSFWTDLALVLGAGLLAWVAGVVVRQPLARLGTFAVASVAFVGVLQWLYNHYGLMPLAFAPLLIFNVGGLGGLVGEYAVERAEKARVRGVLDRLVSKDIVRELLRDRDRYAQLVRGQRRGVTILFSDVRGFTTLSEKAEDPAAFIAQLNEYLGEMVDIVFRHRGTLDKFIGDAVMAVWGSMHTEGPEADACQAVAAALEMRARLAALNARWSAEGKMTLAIGIGVNHGEVIVGGLGSEKSKMEITVMGDAVNTASRLEGLTKDYSLDLLIGESVAAKVSETFRLRTVDRVQVKGKTRPTEVMAVLGPLAEVVSLDREMMLADYEDAILRYRQRNFAGAVGLLEGCHRVEPADGLTELYLTRCRECLEQTPAESWNAVRLMVTK